MLHCMAHAWRKFFDAKDNNPDVAEYALEQIGWLYAIERKAKEQQLTANEIFELRQAEAVPVLESLGKWIKEIYITSLPKARLAKRLAIALKGGLN